MTGSAPHGPGAGRGPRKEIHSAPDVIVLGAPSLDLLHLRGGASTVTGGTALYAALGAELTGAATALVGRWPESFAPTDLATLSGRIDTTHLHIVAGKPAKREFRYDADGALVSRSEAVGLETLVSPSDIPPEWSRAKAAVIPTLGAASHQLAHVMKIRAATEIPLLAVILSPGSVQRERFFCIDALRHCDIAFLSIDDASALADAGDVFAWLEENVRWSIVSMGRSGVAFVSGAPTRVLHLSYDPVDPTGMEEALAGAVTGSLAMGRPVENALQYGLQARAIASSAVGMKGLYSAEKLHIRPDPAATARTPEPAVPDYDRIAAVARSLKSGDHRPFAFTEPHGFFPPEGHPRALEYFFAVVMHQYGFWNLDGDRWSGSMFGIIDGARLKGSDFVWRSATKALLAEKADLTEFLDDNGTCPLPMLETHRDFSRRFREFNAKRPPQAILDEALAEANPLEKLLAILDAVPGYSGDRFRKKSMLLAMALANRPEHFLRARDGEKLTGWAPVVDYHIQRTALRTGIVIPLDRDLRDKLMDRRMLERPEEAAVRVATYHAMEELERLSGQSHAALDLLFFQARSRCPEVGDPDCPHCPLESVCAKQKKLFQPVMRTTDY